MRSFSEKYAFIFKPAHSTANAFTHTVDDILNWGQQYPEDLDKAREDLSFVQRCMHESLRLNPASPVALRRPLQDVKLSDGILLNEGTEVTLDLMAANRDYEIFGKNPITIIHIEKCQRGSLVGA